MVYIGDNMYKVYSVYDKVAKQCDRLFLSLNDDMAVRQFEKDITEALKNNPLYPVSDLEIVCLGYYSNDANIIDKDGSVVSSPVKESGVPINIFLKEIEPYFLNNVKVGEIPEDFKTEDNEV